MFKQLVEPAAKGESAKGGVEVSKHLLGQGGQGVAVQGEQGEGGDPTEGTTWQRSQKIEPKIQNLQHFVDNLTNQLKTCSTTCNKSHSFKLV